MNKPKKVALAYSGGLDTSVIIPWLKENYGCEVVAVCGDIGQGGDELTGLEEKARKTGASEVHIEDMREEFVSEYLWKLVRAGRRLRAQVSAGHLHRAAAAGQEAGGSGARHRLRRAGPRLHGQGQRPGALRADLQGARAAAGGDRAVARVGHRLARGRHRIRARSTTCRSRASTTKIYSRDRNIWHISHEGGALEDPANAAPDEIWMLTKSPAEAPDKPGEVTIGFEKGVPVSVNGKRMKAFELLEDAQRASARSTASAASTWWRTASSA